MNKKKIEDFIGDEVTFIKGQNLVNRNLLKIQNINLDTGKYIVKIYDTDNQIGTKWFTVNLKVIKEKIENFNCDCLFYENNKKPCAHIAASLLKIFSNFSKEQTVEFNDENWKSLKLYFDKASSSNQNHNYNAFFDCSIITDDKKIIPLLLSPDTFAKKFDSNQNVLKSESIKFIDKNNAGHIVKADLFKSIDLHIMDFFLKSNVGTKERSSDPNKFLISTKNIDELYDYLKKVYKLNNKKQVFNLINKQSDNFKVLESSLYKKRGFLLPIKNSKYLVKIQFFIDDVWTNVSPIWIDNKKQIIFLDNYDICFTNNSYVREVDFLNSTFLEWYSSNFHKGICEFKVSNTNNEITDLFEILPKSAIELSFNLKEQAFDHKIKFFYHNKGQPFSVLSTENISFKSTSRLQLYERFITTTFERYLPTKKSNNKALKNKIEIQTLNNIKDWHDGFIQTDLISSKVASNLLNEKKLDFNLKDLKKIFIKNGNLVIICDSLNLSIAELASICQEYNKGNEAYISKDCYYDLQSEFNSKFFNFWSKFDFYNAKLLSENVYEFPKFRAFDLLLAFGGDRKTFEKYVDISVLELIRVFKDFHFQKMPLSKPFNKILRPYQIEGQYWLRTLQKYGFGGILADDMGLGKTVQTISVISQAYSNTPDDIPSLIIVPTSLLLNWESEFKKFAPNIKVITIRGEAQSRQDKISKNKTGVEITSYSYFRRDINIHKNKIYKFIILDEAQNIKNHNSLLAGSIKSVRGEHRIALTGTPIENKLIELWSIFDFVIPGLFGSSRDFLRDYENPIVKNNDKNIVEKLKQKINTFILRRTKDKVLSELPPKTETDIVVELSSEHRKIYDQKLKQAYKYVKNLVDTKKEKQNRFEILKLIIELRQLCCSPLIKDKNFTGENTKFSACMDIIEESVANNKKVLVFTQFLEMINIFESEFKKRNIAFFILSGKTKKDARMESVKKFNSDNTPVFIASLKAGGVGLNLTGAEVVIHYDLWWNLAVQNQATDRVHRIGQTKSVQVYRVIVENSIEERIIKIQEQKRLLSKNIINDDENVLASLSLNDLVELFKPNN